MPSFKLVVEYDGSMYNGFQRQTATSALDRPVNKRKRHERKRGVTVTVQDCLEEAISLWTGVAIPEFRLRCSGRTDKGVHATGQVIAIDIPETTAVLEGLKEWQIQRSINSRLPSDVSVKEVWLCDSKFEPRHDAKQKQYTYRIKFRRKFWKGNNGGDELLPICSGGTHCLRSAHDPSCIWICPWALDDSKMDLICNKLKGKHDFSCFVHKEVRRKKDNTMELECFDVEVLHISNGEAPIVDVKLTLEARGFRRSMVRNLVGFLVDVCRGLAKTNDTPLVLTGSDEGVSLVHSAPACGLCLARVVY